MRASLLAALALLAIGLAIAVLAPPARADGELEGGGNPGVQLVASVESPADVVRSGGAPSPPVGGVDPHGKPGPHATPGAAVGGAADTPPPPPPDPDRLPPLPSA